jgi:ubiquinone/menaquinone biosynthesis C-methylase UbiE
MSEPRIKFSDGAAYEEFMGVWSRYAGEVFLPWLNPRAHLSWLDVGCGNGAFTELIIEHCSPAKVLGIDPSEAQIEYARQRPAGKSAEFRTGDAMALPVADESFDAAVMALVIFFVPDPDKGLAEMVRAVKPGGQVSAYAWDLPGGGFPVAALQAELRAIGIQPHLPPSAEISRMDALEALWSSQLEDVESREITVERTFASFDEWWRIAKLSPSTGSSVGGLTREQSETVRTKLRERLETAADGSIRTSARANAVKGRVR